MIYQTFIILLLSSFAATAQLGDISNDKFFEAKFDVQIRGGLSIPLGKYRLLTDISDDRSAAGLGFYTEISSSFTPLLSSPWRIALTLGYMHHSFQAEASKIYFSLSTLEGSPWNSAYGLLGIYFTSRKKLYYSIGASAGILGYSGGNITSGTTTLDTIKIQTWTYNVHPVGAVQASLSIGYHFTSKFSMFANVAVLYAAGLRRGRFTEERLLINIQSQRTIEQRNSSVQNQTTIFALNLGIGFRYKIYDDAEEFNYKFNIEENQ